MGTSVAKAAPSTTGTSLYSQGCRSMTEPSGKRRVTPGAKIPKWVRESSAVSGPECPATHRIRAQAQVAVLGHLAEQAHRSVLEVRERAVGRAGTPVAIEVRARVLGEVDRGHAREDAGVGELGDLLRQQCTAGVLVALVPAEAGHLAPVGGEAGDVGGVGQVGRAGDEQRPAVLGLGIGVDVRAPGAESGPVGRRLAGSLVQLRRIGAEVGDAPSRRRHPPWNPSATVRGCHPAPSRRCRAGGPTAIAPAPRRAAGRPWRVSKLVRACSATAAGSSGAG